MCLQPPPAIVSVYLFGFRASHVFGFLFIFQNQSSTSPSLLNFPLFPIPNSVSTFSCQQTVIFGYLIIVSSVPLFFLCSYSCIYQHLSMVGTGLRQTTVFFGTHCDNRCFQSYKVKYIRYLSHCSRQLLFCILFRLNKICNIIYNI